jgi:prepilin-type N-terminal cleavage/methylation domain-containing protein
MRQLTKRVVERLCAAENIGRRKAGWRKRAGFTLIELIAVIAILAIIAATLVGTVTNHISNAKYASADSDLASLKSALDQFMITHNGTLIGLLANGTSKGALTGSAALANMSKLDPFLSKPVATTYDPWQRPYQISANYNTTTNQGDVVIYVLADTTLGLNGKDVSYKTVQPNGTEGTFAVTGVAVNPLRKAKGATGDKGEPMAIRVMGQYEMQ